MSKLLKENTGLIALLVVWLSFMGAMLYLAP